MISPPSPPEHAEFSHPTLVSAATQSYVERMVYRGQVKGGVVVFETAAPPEGAAVRVEAEGRQAQAPALGQTSIWDKLKELSGVLDDLPADFARNHDHYIHGARKK